MRLVVYCTAAERRVLRCSGGRLRPEAQFSADESGLAAFRQYLQHRAGAIVTLVADVAGEEFHEEQIPLLRGRDRDAVLQRRLAQRYPDARLAAALSLGRAEVDPPKERLLLASFASAHPFTPWLDALRTSRARLAGVCSTAQFAPTLAAPRAAQCIVASVHSGGLRTCFLERGRLRFARFEALAVQGPDAHAVRLQAEITRLADYLTTLRVLAADARAVPLVVIAGAAQRGPIERALSLDARFALRFEPLEEAARRVGIRGAPPELGAEQLALALAATRPPREQYARAEDRRAFTLWRLQRAWFAAGALGLAACASYAGALAVEAQALRAEAGALRVEALQATQRYERMAAGFPATPTSAENLKLAVQELRRLAARTALPEAALAHVADALGQCPQVALDALEWRVAPVARPAGAEADAHAQTIEITGRVVSAPGAGARTVHAEIQRFAAALQAGQGWHLVRSQLPLDVTPQGTLTGGSDAAAGGGASRFVIAITRPLG